jgi:hypothetical protein
MTSAPSAMRLSMMIWAPVSFFIGIPSASALLAPARFAES